MKHTMLPILATLLLLCIASCAKRIPEAVPAPEVPFAQLKVVNDEPFPDMYLKHYGVNPTIDTAEEYVSTFSVDVDTASYAIARAYLQRQALPPEEAIRVEEFVNSFDYGYRAPDGEPSRSGASTGAPLRRPGRRPGRQGAGPFAVAA